jgi:predicted Zn-dependent protease
MTNTNTYQAIVLDDRLPGGRKSGELTVTMHSIVFKYEGGDVVWSLNETQLSRGGAGNALIFLKHPRHPEVTLYTTDRKFLSDKMLNENYVAIDKVTKLKRHYYSRWVAASIAVAVILTPFVLLFLFRDGIVRSIANKVPVKYEQEVGEKLFTLLSTGYKIVDDSTLNAQFKQVVAPLEQVVDNKDHRFSFYIINDTTVNAFALPGGKVVVNSGLILKSDSWGEVQGVLAHEIAHVTLRHHVRGVINQQGFFFLIAALFGDYSDMVVTLASYGSQLESLMYSRKFEFEADNQAFEYLGKAGINQKGMVSFFEKLQKANPNEVNSSMLKMLSTHPATADRIANLKAKAGVNSASTTVGENKDINEFQILLKRQL